MIAEDLTALETRGRAISSEIGEHGLYENLAVRIKNKLLKDHPMNLFHVEKGRQSRLKKKQKGIFPEIEIKVSPKKSNVLNNLSYQTPR